MASERSLRAPIVGIGASAGGLEALREMLGSVSRPTGMAFVIIQHLDPHHESMLAQLLARDTALTVAQAVGGERPEAEHVYIIPPGFGLAIEQGVLKLVNFEQPRGMRRPIDDFFETLGEDQQQFSACVILSGTGADGSVGMRAIKEHGGIALAQEPTSARYDGMPLSAVATGLVDFVREPSELIDCLRQYFDRRLGRGNDDGEASRVSFRIDELCRRLRETVGHDFSGYKRSTLERRIARRMQVLGIDDGDAYLARLQNDPQECEALLRDLLINVTRFFRDTELFEVLDGEAIRPIVARAVAAVENGDVENAEIRVWVAGCSSGEEAYSIAMLIDEACREHRARPVVQVFATDIDETMLGIAREGRYPPAALADMPEALRDRYLFSRGDHVVVVPQIRDMVRFSNHSLIKDPPFSRLDLISCRNLLIYFGDRLQQSVMPLLHYALKPDSYLFLGPSETIGRFDDLFDTLDARARLFRRRPGRAHYPIDLSIGGNSRRLAATAAQRGEQRGRPDEDLAIKRLLERYAPASMVLNGDGEILNSYGRLSRYFEFPNMQQGVLVASALARPGLREVLMPLLRQVAEHRTRVIVRDVAVVSEFGTQQLAVIADPLPNERILLVFRESGDFDPHIDEDLVEMGPSDGQVQLLEDELRLTRHRLRVTVEELETVNEELKSSNEEMMSMNEELQSTNEELSTVNDELKTKVDQLTQANSDLRNFFESTQLAVVVLDEMLNIRSYTDAATRIFPFKPSDRGRPLGEVTTMLETDQYLVDARAVIGGKGVIERLAAARDGALYRLRTMPYRALDGLVNGVTMVLTDISDAASLEAQLAAERERLALALRVAGVGVWEYFVEQDRVVADHRVEQFFDLDSESDHSIEQVVGRIHPDDRAKVQAGLRRAISGEVDYNETFRVCHRDGTTVTLRGLGRLISASSPARLVGVNYDVTAEAQANTNRELLLREMNHRVKNLFAIIGGMVSLAARSATDVPALATTLRERISALGRAHSLTTDGAVGDARDLGSIISAALAPYLDHPGLDIAGPPVLLADTCVSSLALLLHELATNSVKYGGLADPSAKVAIHWRDEGAAGIAMSWSETMEKSRVAPTGKGFGSTLLDVAARQLGATIDTQVDDHHFGAAMRFPAELRA